MSNSQSSTELVTNSYGNGTASPTPSGAIRKKLMGYVGFSNLPNQVHRRSVRKGFNFTAMVVGMFFLLSITLRFTGLLHLSLFCIGESGLGKSTLINTLFNTTLYPGKEPLPPSAERPQTVSIESISAGVFLFVLFFLLFYSLLHPLFRY